MTFFSPKLVLLIPLFVIGIFGFTDTQAEITRGTVIILPALDANLIINGSFEDVKVYDHDKRWQTFDSSQIPGWTVYWNEFNEPYNCADTPKVEIQHGILGGASNGVNHAELDSHCDMRFTSSTIIQQTVGVIPDEEYELSWYAKKRPRTGDDTNGLAVFVNDIQVMTIDSMSKHWEYYTYNFVAESDYVTISFVDTGIPNSRGTFLDSIKLVIITEYDEYDDDRYGGYDDDRYDDYFRHGSDDTNHDINLLENGSFEDVPVKKRWSSFTTDTDNIGWEISWNEHDGYPSCPQDGKLDVMKRVFGGAHSGVQYAELDSKCYKRPATSVVIQQTVEVIPGEEYELLWDSKKRPGTGNRSNGLEVSINNYEIDYIYPMSRHWETSSYIFTAYDDTVTISFADVGRSDSRGTFVDNIILQKVLE